MGCFPNVGEQNLDATLFMYTRFSKCRLMTTEQHANYKRSIYRPNLYQLCPLAVRVRVVKGQMSVSHDSRQRKVPDLDENLVEWYACGVRRLALISVHYLIISTTAMCMPVSNQGQLRVRCVFVFPRAARYRCFLLLLLLCARIYTQVHSPSPEWAGVAKR